MTTRLYSVNSPNDWEMRKPPKRNTYNYKKRKSQYASLREQLYDAQGGKCFWCNNDAWLPTEGYKTTPSPTMATVDHLLDGLAKKMRLEFYGDRIVVMACLQCNSDRNKLMHEIYKAIKRAKNLGETEPAPP